MTDAQTDPPSAGYPDLPSQRVKILLVDDRQDKLLALSSIFDGQDLELVTALSGREALRLVLAHEFAVILLDVSMPIMDGFETAALIRQRKHSKHVPIIFITAFNDTETHALCGYSLGAVDYMYAPVVPDVLRAKVAVFIDLFRKNRDINRRSALLRQEAEHRATNLESRLDRLLNRLNVGVFSSTFDGMLLSANLSFYRLFGIDPASAPGTVGLVGLYVQESDRTELLSRLVSDGQVQDYHVRQRHIDGSLIWVSLSKLLVTDADGRQHIDGLVEDITARKGVEAALLAKAEELARSNAELEEFAYVASHDLQEPMRMVSSYSSLLVERYADQMDDKGKSYFAQIIGGAKRMHELIRNILDYSKIGNLPIRTMVDCNEVLTKVIYSLQGLITDSGAQVTWDRLPTVIGEPLLLGQVFQNLIGNAIKFHHKERPAIVHVGAERHGAWWTFSISDNGIGIAPQYFEKIFGVFQRLHTREEYAGTGIGLAICRKAIQKHGGIFTVESELDRGSVFRFTLSGGDTVHALAARSA